MNIPFELIFVVLFFVLPALSGVLRRVQGRGKPPPPTGRPRSRPTRTDTTAPSADTSTQTDTSTDIPRWLEEAQRRVREAQQGETDRRGGQAQAPKQPTSDPQTGGPLVQPRPSTGQNPARPVATRQAPTQPRPTNRENYRSRPVSSERTAAPPLRVQRLGKKNAAAGSYNMRFDEQTLMTGFVWHQILSPPLSKRRNRQSQRQP